MPMRVPLPTHLWSSSGLPLVDAAFNLDVLRALRALCRARRCLGLTIATGRTPANATPNNSGDAISYL
eukprot:10397586-Lingulodinium_polyedra.AAC.1